VLALVALAPFTLYAQRAPRKPADPAGNLAGRAAAETGLLPSDTLLSRL
jgi:hypothetical protein